MADTTTEPIPSKSDIAWRVVKMVFHSNTINAQTDISGFFTPDRLIFYQNLFNGPVAQSLESSPYRWTDATASEFSGITTAGQLEAVVESHLVEADTNPNPKPNSKPNPTSTTGTSTNTAGKPTQGGKNA